MYLPKFLAWYVSMHQIERQLSLNMSSTHDIQISLTHDINKTTEHMKAETPHLNTKVKGSFTGFISQNMMK